MDEVLQDSTTFYYDNEHTLLFLMDCRYPSSCKEYPVTYENKTIEYWNGTYLKDENDRITNWKNPPSNIDYIYDNELITLEKTSYNDFVTDEYYFLYENDVLVKDSMVHRNQNDVNEYITVYEYTYTDTLVPEFAVHYSGLLEFPSKHQFLIREQESIEHGILYKFSYEISENELIEIRQFHDTFHDQDLEVWTTRYLYEKR